MRKTPAPTAADTKLASFHAEINANPPTNGDIVKAGRTSRDIAYGDLIEIVRHAELQVYEGNIGVKLQAEVDNALRQMRERQHVDPAVINEIARLGREWQVQRELGGNGEGGGS
jgi:hypothetical protein